MSEFVCVHVSVCPCVCVCGYTANEIVPSLFPTFWCVQISGNTGDWCTCSLGIQTHPRHVHRCIRKY